jgi:hypothetical protein
MSNWIERLDELKKTGIIVDETDVKKLRIGDRAIMYYNGDENDPMNIRVYWFQAIVERKPNEICFCGSDKKYKKCCNLIQKK